MKLFHTDSKMLRLAADFVQRGQPVVNVERRILEPLRHDRPRALLEFQNEMLVLGARFVVQVFGEPEQQNIAQKIEDRFFQRRVPSFRRRHRALNNRAIFFADGLARRDVSPINRKTGDRFANGARQGFQREIPEPPVLFRKPVEHVAENVHVVRQRQPHHEPLFCVNQMAERHRMADEPLERFRNRLFGGRVDQNVRDQLREFVPGRSVHRPIRA